MDPLVLLGVGALVVVSSILVLRLHAFVALFLGALLVASLTSAANLRQFAESKNLSSKATEELVSQSIGSRLATGFGSTCAEIGLLIAMASLIGKALLESGAADRIVRSTLRALGEARASLAFLASGFVLGIPVFFDTVFYLLLPLGKAMATRNERNYLLYILSIVAGATMTHSLVPPTPGPLAVAGMLNVDIGMMMLGGTVVGIFAVAVGYGYALWANRRWPIPLRDSADVSVAELHALAAKDSRKLPPFWLAVLPILLPVLLIIASASSSRLFGAPDSATVKAVSNMGDKNVALAIGVAVGLAMWAYYRRMSAKEFAADMQSALASAGVIILITAAGGMFGTALQQAGVGARIQELASNYRIAVLPLAFFVTALIRTAQGSATVAMITAAGILQGFAASPAALGFHPLYLALAIGCGSKPFPWMNDSGFWVIGRMSGLTEAETLKTSSTMMALMGCSGMLVVLVLAKLVPMPVAENLL